MEYSNNAADVDGGGLMWGKNTPAEFPDADRQKRFLKICPQLKAIFSDYATKGHMPSVS